VVERALRYRPAAVMLSFGDPAPLVEPVLAAGVRLIVQVTDLDEAQQAIDLVPAADLVGRLAAEREQAFALALTLAGRAARLGLASS